ncbi:MAG: hypothetical protein WAN03_03890, partial [Candidatus Sulfotelmatobacter sp.]
SYPPRFSFPASPDLPRDDLPGPAPCRCLIHLFNRCYLLRFARKHTKEVLNLSSGLGRVEQPSAIGQQI